MYEMNETAKLQRVLKDLQLSKADGGGDSAVGASASSSASTQLMETHALQIQPHSRQKDLKKFCQVFDKAAPARGSAPRPRAAALAQEPGGKARAAARELEAAPQAFFQVLKSRGEAGGPSRLKRLKRLVVASAPRASAANPLGSQGARPR